MRIFSFNNHTTYLGIKTKAELKEIQEEGDRKKERERDKREKKMLKPLRFSAHDDTPYDMNHAHFLFFIFTIDIISILAYFEQQKKRRRRHGEKQFYVNQ